MSTETDKTRINKYGCIQLMKTDKIAIGEEKDKETEVGINLRNFRGTKKGNAPCSH